MLPPETPTTRFLSAADYRTLALAALGGALESYDFVIFVFFATVLGELFFPPEMPDWLRQVQVFGIFAIGYLARPLGGIVMAHFGDLTGRKRMFTFSVAMMGAATFGMGLLPTYAEIGIWAPIALLVLRIAQGVAFGGEVPGAWVFVAEHVPGNRIGFACGTLMAGLMAGILLGSLVANAINSFYAPADVESWAWRLPFLLGGACGLISIYLRTLLQETPIFRELEARKALAAELPLKVLLRDHRGGVWVSMLLTWMLSGLVVVVILMTPTLLQWQGVPATTALTAHGIATFFLGIGCIASGLHLDRVGAGRFFATWSVALGVSVWLFYTHGLADPSYLLPLYAMMGILVGVIVGVPFVMVRAFPAPVRYSGVSFSYNVGYALSGGLTPVMVPVLLAIHPLAHAYYIMGLCGLGFAVGLWLLRAEAQRR